MASARETLCFGAPKSTFRDKCKGSELFYFTLQSSCQVQQHLGHGGDRRGAQDFLTGAVNHDFWACASFANFVAGTALFDPRCADFVAGAALGEPGSAGSVAAAALGELRSADFVEGAALGEPRNADFVAGAALCEPRSADFVQISWHAQ